MSQNNNSERIPTHRGKVPFLTTSEMVEVDRAMIEDFHIELVQMMENAGRNLAHLARVRFLGGEPEGKRVVVLAGTGGNGGGALVCARCLHNWGSDVRVMTATAAEALTPVPAHQLDILRRMGLPIAGAGAGAEGPGELSTDGPFDLIIDGLIGYSLSGAPRGAAAELIRWANRVDAPVLALDTPSGLDTTTGTVFDPAVQATATMTLALPKEGLRAPGAETFVGELYLADISVPPQLYAEPGLGLRVGRIFARSEIVRLGR